MSTKVETTPPNGTLSPILQGPLYLSRPVSPPPSSRPPSMAREQTSAPDSETSDAWSFWDYLAVGAGVAAVAAGVAAVAAAAYIADHLLSDDAQASPSSPSVGQDLVLADDELLCLELHITGEDDHALWNAFESNKDELHREIASALHAEFGDKFTPVGTLYYKGSIHWDWVMQGAQWATSIVWNLIPKQTREKIVTTIQNTVAAFFKRIKLNVTVSCRWAARRYDQVRRWFGFNPRLGTA